MSSLPCLMSHRKVGRGTNEINSQVSNECHTQSTRQESRDLEEVQSLVFAGRNSLASGEVDEG